MGGWFVEEVAQSDVRMRVERMDGLGCGCVQGENYFINSLIDWISLFCFA